MAVTFNSKDNDTITNFLLLSFVTLGGIFSIFLFIFFSAFVKAWALAHLWNWFISPLGVSKLTIAWSYGIMLVVNILSFGTDYTMHDFSKTEKKKALQSYVGKMIGYALLVFVGSIVHTYFM